jgi:hypothetical protein
MDHVSDPSSRAIETKIPSGPANSSPSPTSGHQTSSHAGHTTHTKETFDALDIFAQISYLIKNPGERARLHLKYPKHIDEQGHAYNYKSKLFNSEGEPKVAYFTCSNEMCKATMTLDLKMRTQQLHGQHGHDPDGDHRRISAPAKVMDPGNMINKSTALEEVKRLATEDPNRPPHEIQTHLHKNFAGRTVAMPTSQEIHQTFHNIKHQNKIDDRDALKYFKTLRQEDFTLLVGDTPGDQFCIMASPFMLRRARDNVAGQFFIDGYHKVPRKWHQLLSILVFDDATKGYYPCVHILISNQRQTTYEKVLSITKALILLGGPSDMIPKAIVVDFEQGLMNAVEKIFPNSKIVGCIFHFVQALWRYASGIGLRVADIKKETKSVVSALTLLIFVPKQRVLTFFAKIKEHFSNVVFAPFFDYFDRFWMRENMIDRWNLTGAPLDLTEIKRTNNCVESFHSQLLLRMKKVK